MSSTEPEYLDTQAVADQLGIRRKSVYEMLSRGYLPEPDMVYIRHPLWLPETISEWRKHYRKRRQTPRVPRRHRVKTAKTRGKPPKIHGAVKPSSKTGASRPAIATVSDQIASQVASALRQDGFHCTTADVVELAAWKDEESVLEHEREKLRQRIVAKLRGLKRQTY